MNIRVLTNQTPGYAHISMKTFKKKMLFQQNNETTHAGNLKQKIQLYRRK